MSGLFLILNQTWLFSKWCWWRSKKSEFYARMKSDTQMRYAVLMNSFSKQFLYKSWARNLLMPVYLQILVKVRMAIVFRVT